MSEFFTEHLVKRPANGTTMLKKVGLVVATVVISFLLMMFIPSFAFLLIAGLIALDVFLFGKMNLEFEYIYYNGDMDIDKIMNMQSRKRVFSTNIKEIDIVAPKGSPEMMTFQRLKVLDFSSQVPENRIYEMVTSYKGEKVRVLFEPNDVILNGMKYLAPRKVFI